MARIPLPRLHEQQGIVARCDARFVVLAAGRRWGKTLFGCGECVRVGAGGGRAWWVAPSYKLGAVGWRGLRVLGGQIPGTEIRLGDRMLRFSSGGSVQVRSADDPQSLRGEGLDLAICDEAAFMAEAAWGEALRPALSDREGRAIFISTPKGRGWFWRIWQQAADRDDWQAFRFPTAGNPFIACDEIEAARRQLPDRVFRQEYLAEFVEDGGGVFRGIPAVATGKPRDAEDDHDYIIGIDWGKHEDWTVAIVIDATERRVVAMDRFQRIDYRLQVGRLETLVDEYQPLTIVAERNSMGEPLVEELQYRGLPVEPFTTTNASKAQAIDALALAIEREELTLLDDGTMVNELQAFEAHRLPSGSLRYQAPDGLHDDIVMALALAWSAVAYAGPMAVLL